MELKTLQSDIGAWAARKGWDFEEDQIPEKLMLICTEIAEAMEDFRVDNHGMAWNEYRRDNGNKPIGFGIELADAAIRILHLCDDLGIDLDAMIEVKMSYNEKREYRHGGKRA